MFKGSRFILPVLVAIGLAATVPACNSTTNLNAVTTAAPSPVPTGTTALVTATHNGGTLNNQAVLLYNGTGSGPYGCGTTLLQTLNTNTSGQVTFTGLTPGAVYCFTYSLVQGGVTYSAVVATNNWATSLGVLLQT